MLFCCGNCRKAGAFIVEIQQQEFLCKGHLCDKLDKKGEKNNVNEKNITLKIENFFATIRIKYGKDIGIH